LARLFFGYFLLAKQKKVARPTGRNLALKTLRPLVRLSFAYFSLAKQRKVRPAAGKNFGEAKKTKAGAGAAPYTAAMTSIADLRKSYERAELDESASQADPLAQFDQWLKEAITAQVPEPNAMTLATVGSDLRPSTRIVLIKGYDAQGIVWYTNFESRKGKELAGNPFAALQFHWVELERVVRIEGRVEKVSDLESDAYFGSRPLDSRIGAWASPQSQVISGRGVLVANAAKYAAQFLLNPPRPPHWGGYRLRPDNWQFWQGRKSRLHDRLEYRLADGPGQTWLRQRLAP
jgi:pyridoxamine 5'-phosphate oxidase